MARRPNVLFVFGDQWRAQSTGFGGNREVFTPALDRFAEGAVHLPHAVATVPCCSPWRASFLTGLNPDRHGLFLNDAPLRADFPGVGRAFAAAGYDTGWIGKWHVNGGGRLSPVPPERRHGFGYWKALECTHRYHESYYYSGDSARRGVWPGYDAFAQTQDALRWLHDRRGGDRPFFLALSWGPPHSPFLTAPRRFNGRYDPAALTLPPNVPSDLEGEVRRNLAGYYGHCSALDEAFGQLRDGLRTLGLEEDTLVVFTADHGDMIGGHGLYDKQGPWEESVRVPLLLRWPRGLGTEGCRLNLAFHTTDFFPTLCGLAGVPVPEEAQPQGRDRAGHLRNRTLPADNDAFLAAYANHGNWPRIAEKRGDPLVQAREYRGVRTLTHTYVESRQGAWLLHDNAADPWQMRNLAGDPGAEGVCRALAARLREYLREYNDPFPPGEELVRRWEYPVDATGTYPIPDGAEWARTGI